MNKRLMKLAGLLKEDINPYEDNNVEEAVANFIKEKVEDEIALAAGELDALGEGTYCIYDVISSRGYQEATVVRRDAGKQEALEAIKETLLNRWELIVEWAEEDEDTDETNAESMIDYMEKAGEFIGGTEGVQDYSGYPALEIGLEEEGYLGIVHSKDKEEAEDDYGVYEDEMGNI